MGNVIALGRQPLTRRNQRLAQALECLRNAAHDGRDFVVCFADANGHIVRLDSFDADLDTQASVRAARVLERAARQARKER